MNALEVIDLTLRAGSFTVQDISLTVAEGEYFVLMGMTGCGKSLLLKAVCGLAQIARGRVRLRGRDITGLEARFRNIGYVPQDGGLFPHLDVLRNITFPLTVAGMKPVAARSAVEGIVASLGLEELLVRSVAYLSGGERQKVALARALARKPELLVLDEPVCALDEPTRRDTCRELRRVQEEFAVATVHVCHSRDEAALVSDRVGVMCEGRLLDTGTLQELATGSNHEAVQRLLNWN
ncbi:MAG: ABC transporter ATP-binding protein [Planctomycetes bacterium]|nr:ABC transporter ATP-binding protein [Planctomycetota bacterium]